MYDILIIGGGLAGLVNAIELSKAGLHVALIEKQTYPFHRVCGEYISNETLPYLQTLGFDPFAQGAVALTEFRVSAPSGRSLRLPLDLGGFGLSRYTMDAVLSELAQKAGAHLYTGQKVLRVASLSEGFAAYTDQSPSPFRARVLIGAYGKRSHLDKDLQSDFFYKRSPYVGVKYHIRTSAHPEAQIALHNFKQGYCGISRIEAGKYCLCYLTTREQLRQYGNIAAMEQAVLLQNPYLRHIWATSEFLYAKPLVINEVGFLPKSRVSQGVLMCGDTTGMVAPLCGNGMAMAIHGAKVLASLVKDFFAGTLSRAALEQEYQKAWQKRFAQRLWAGRNIQHWFGHPRLTEALVRSAQWMPRVAKVLMRQTHGPVF